MEQAKTDEQQGGGGKAVKEKTRPQGWVDDQVQQTIAEDRANADPEYLDRAIEQQGVGSLGRGW